MKKLIKVYFATISAREEKFPVGHCDSICPELTEKDAI
jgi:hypothetical protein